MLKIQRVEMPVHGMGHLEWMQGSQSRQQLRARARGVRLSRAQRWRTQRGVQTVLAGMRGLRSRRTRGRSYKKVYSYYYIPAKFIYHA